MRGKNKCKILKEIRQKIADENDIPYVTQECSFQGECSGTCPKCEAELRYLEEQLEKRKRLGKTVTVAALSAGLVVGAVSLTSNPKEELRSLATEELITKESTQHVWDRNVVGLVEAETTEDDMHVLLGYAPPENWMELDGEPIPDESLVLEGDVAYVETEFAGAPTHSMETSGDE